MKHIKKIKIDIDKKNYEVIPSVQYDSNTRFLHINLLNGAVPFNLTGCSVKISGTKPDGTAIFNNCTVINPKEGFVEVELTEQMNAAPGTLKCELKLYNGKGVLTTKQFEIEVTASVTSKEITSSNEFKALEEALSKVNNIDNKFESLTEAAVKEATEKEIQKQIANGNMANLTIAKGSITKDKLDPNIKFGIEDGEVTKEKLKEKSVGFLNIDNEELNLKFMTIEKTDVSNKNEGYIYMHFKNKGQSGVTKPISVTVIIDNYQNESLKIYLRMYANNTGGISGASYNSNSITIEGKSMKKCVFTFSNVYLNVAYVTILPFITTNNSELRISDFKFDFETEYTGYGGSLFTIKEIDKLLENQIITNSILPIALKNNIDSIKNVLSSGLNARRVEKSEIFGLGNDYAYANVVVDGLIQKFVGVDDNVEWRDKIGNENLSLVNVSINDDGLYEFNQGGYMEGFTFDSNLKKTVQMFFDNNAMIGIRVLLGAAGGALIYLTGSKLYITGTTIDFKDKFLALTFVVNSAKKYDLYVNGKVVKTNVTIDSSPLIGGGLTSQPSWYFRGTCKGILSYNRVLSREEIIKNINQLGGDINE